MELNDTNTSEDLSYNTLKPLHDDWANWLLRRIKPNATRAQIDWTKQALLHHAIEYHEQQLLLSAGTAKPQLKQKSNKTKGK